MIMKRTTSGVTSSTTAVEKKPMTKDRFRSRSPYSLPRSNCPAPSSLPTMMPPALPMPLHRQQIRSRTTAATELAAAASPPIWPTMAV